ncbi:hypothetical protein [Priestia megaterium]|uniref:hypothetical protein n=1 Tax=Priestia megaterium TaxID=1404 RepID=UPI002E23E54F|nr:hypothetical protein [Priestia megaterium]
MEFRVVFTFDNGNSTEARVEAESVEMLREEIQSCKGWYNYSDSRHGDTSINLNSVSFFRILESGPRKVASFKPF